MLKYILLEWVYWFAACEYSFNVRIC